MHIIFKRVSTVIDFRNFLKNDTNGPLEIHRSSSFTDYVDPADVLSKDKSPKLIQELKRLIHVNHPNACYDETDLQMGILTEIPNGPQKFLPLKKILIQKNWHNVLT